MPKCEGCGKNYKNLKNHLLLSKTCPSAIEFREGEPPVREPFTTRDNDSVPPQEDDTLTLEEVERGKFTFSGAEAEKAPVTSESAATPKFENPTLGASIREIVAETASAILGAVEQRIAKEREVTNNLLAESLGVMEGRIADRVAEGLIQRSRAEAGAQSQEGASQAPQGDNGSSTSNWMNILGPALAKWLSGQGGGGDFSSLTKNLEGLAALIDSVTTFTYKPYIQGHNDAMQNVLQLTRLGVAPGDAAEQVLKNPPHSGSRPKTTEGQ